VTHRIENAPNVDVEDATVFRLGGLIQWAYPLNAGVVKSDVEASEFVDRKIDHPLHVRIFRHIGADERRLTAEFFNFSDDLRAFFFTSAGEDNLGASTSKFGSGLLADAGSPSGHECDFV